MGALVFEVGYHPRRKIHVITVACFSGPGNVHVHRLGVQKHAKLGEKRCVFGHIDKFWKEHDKQILRKMHAKMHI